MVGLPSRGIKSGVSVRCGCWCFCSHSVRSVGSQSQFYANRKRHATKPRTHAPRVHADTSSTKW
jgi:hypothetical protein